MKPPRCEEIWRIVGKSGNKSTPGSNGISFFLYIKMSQSSQMSSCLPKANMEKLSCQHQWMIADGLYIPKEKNSSYLSPQCRRK